MGRDLLVCAVFIKVEVLCQFLQAATHLAALHWQLRWLATAEKTNADEACRVALHRLVLSVFVLVWFVLVWFGLVWFWFGLVYHSDVDEARGRSHLHAVNLVHCDRSKRLFQKRSILCGKIQRGREYE